MVSLTGMTMLEVFTSCKNRGAFIACCVCFYCFMTGMILLIIGLTGLDTDELRGTCYLDDSITSANECTGDSKAWSNCWTCETISENSAGEILLESPRFHGVQFRSQGEEFTCNHFIGDPGKGATADTRIGVVTCQTQGEIMLKDRQQECVLEADNRCLTDLARNAIYGTQSVESWIRLIFGVVFCACSAIVPGAYLVNFYKPAKDEVTKFEKKEVPLDDRAKLDQTWARSDGNIRESWPM